MPRGDQKYELIESIPLFAECSDEEVDAIAGSADLIDVPAGMELVTQGKSTNELVAIGSGSVAVTKDGAQVSTLGAGEFFGEIALITGAPRTATVTASEPSTLLVLTDREFWRLAKENPALPSAVLKVFAERLHPDTF
jgi:CRP/FNR family transcriptional regulator, cyclic AMP receptor protein